MTSVRVQVLLRRYHFYCIYPKLQTNISPAFETNAFSSYGIHCIYFTMQTLIDKPDNIPIAGRKSVLPGVPSCVEVQEQRLRSKSPLVWILLLFMIFTLDVFSRSKHVFDSKFSLFYLFYRAMFAREFAIEESPPPAS